MFILGFRLYVNKPLIPVKNRAAVPRGVLRSIASSFVALMRRGSDDVPFP